MQIKRAFKLATPKEESLNWNSKSDETNNVPSCLFPLKSCVIRKKNNCDGCHVQWIQSANKRTLIKLRLNL